MPCSSHTPRVLHVVISLQPGGLEKLVVEWTAYRNRSAPGSTAVCCLDSETAGELAVGDGSVFRLDADRGKFPWDHRAARRLRNLCRGRDADVHAPFDVVHSHNLAAWQYAALATWRTDVRHIHTEHGSLPYASGFLNRWRIRWMERQTDGLVAVSEATATELMCRHGFFRKQLTVIPNGITVHEKKMDHDEEYRRRYRREFNLPDDALVLGSVGRLAPIKGYDRLISVVADVRQRLQQMTNPGADNLYLLLVGDGPERAALERLAMEYGVSDRIRFAGYRDDARDLFSAMDVFVLPSRGEGLSLALLEAMAAGVPVMATDTGETRNVIADGAAGIILPNATQSWPQIIAAQLADLNSPATTQRVTAAAERVRNHYMMEATLAAYERLYYP